VNTVNQLQPVTVYPLTTTKGLHCRQNNTQTEGRTDRTMDTQRHTWTEGQDI